jgi:hypothetical protein
MAAGKMTLLGGIRDICCDSLCELEILRGHILAIVTAYERRDAGILA